MSAERPDIMYTPKGSTMKSEGIAVARAIASGDISHARNLVSMYRLRSRSVAEMRAINGAVRYVNRTFGATLNCSDFHW